jgi:type IV secretory pathway component VirB8
MDLDFERENRFKQFISESRAWYSASYLEEITFARKLTLLFLVMIALVVLTSNFLNQQDKEVVFYFPLSVEDGSDDLYNIKSIALTNSSIEEEIADYMVRRYLVLRESYSPKLLEPREWENLLQNIAGLSSYSIFEEFLEGILPNKNNASPILKYRLQKTATPLITRVIFTQSLDKKPLSAEIAFSVKVCDLSFLSNCSQEERVAKIDFEMSSISKSISLDENFRFKILSYQTMPSLGEQ